MLPLFSISNESKSLHVNPLLRPIEFPKKNSYMRALQKKEDEPKRIAQWTVYRTNPAHVNLKPRAISKYPGQHPQNPVNGKVV